MGDAGNIKVYEGGEEDKSASKTGTGGYEDRTTARENYEAIQNRDDYEEGDAVGEDEPGMYEGGWRDKLASKNSAGMKYVYKPTITFTFPPKMEKKICANQLI